MIGWLGRVNPALGFPTLVLFLAFSLIKQKVVNEKSNKCNSPMFLQ